MAVSVRLSVEGDAADAALRQFAQTGENSLARVRVALDQLAQSGATTKVRIEQIDPSMQKLEAALNRVRSRYDDLYRAEAAVSSAQATINKSVEAGLISLADSEALIGKVRRAHNDNTDTMGRATVSNRQLGAAVQNLGFQLNDIATSLASGGSPLRVLAQQAGQVQQSLSQGGGAGATLAAFGQTIRGLITPTTVLVGGLAALAAGFVVVAARASSTQAELRSFNVELSGMGVSGLATADSLVKVAQRLRDTGSSAADAKAAIEAVIRAGLNPAAAGQIATAGRDLGAVLGGNGLDTLITALSGGVNSTLALGLRLRALTADEAANIRTMAEHGRAAEALDLAFQKIAGTLSGKYNQSLSEGQRALRDFRAAWDDMLDSLANTNAFQKALGALGELATRVALLAKGDFVELGNRLLGDAAKIAGGAFTPGVKLPVPYGPPNPGAPAASTGNAAGNFLDTSQVTLSTDTLQRLAAALDAGVKHLPEGYALLATSTTGGNHEPGGFHPLGEAIDVKLVGPNGPIPNKGPDTTGLYGQLAGYAYLENQRLYPGTPFAWGGSFGTVRGGTVSDLMHFDAGTERGNLGPYASAIAARLQVQADVAGEPSITAPGNPTATDLIEQEIKARTREIEVYKRQGAEADILRAKLQAEQFNRDHNITGLDAERNVRNAVATAMARADAEQQKLIQAQELDISNTNMIAKAYGESAAAGKRAELQGQAITEVYQRYGTVTNRTAEIQARFNQLLVAEEAAERRRNAVDMRGFADTQQQLQLEIALVGQTSEEISKQLTLLREKQRIERDFSTLPEKEKEARLAAVAATADLVQKLTEAERQQQRVNSAVSSIAASIDNSLTQAIQNAFDGQKVTDWGATVRSVLSQIVAQLISMAIIKPAIGSVLSALGFNQVAQNYPTFGQVGGFLGSIFGGGSSGGGQVLRDSGGNVIGTLSNAKSAVDLFGGGGSSSGGFFGGVSDFINNTIGTSLGFAPAGSLVEGATGASFLLPGEIAGVDFGSAAAAGSLGAPVFGTTLTSVLGPIGAGVGILGALGVFDGLFGGKKSVGPNANATPLIDYANGGKLYLAGSGADNGGNAGQVVEAANAAITAVNTLLDQLGGSLTTNLPWPNIGQGQEGTYYTTTDPNQKNYVGNLGDAAQALALAFLRAGPVAGVSPTVQTILSNSKATDLTGLTSDLSFAQTYDNLKKAAEDAFKAVGDTADQIGPFATALDQINVTFADLTAKATDFGLSLDPVNAGLAEATKRLRDDFGKSLDTALNAATGQDYLNRIAAVAAQFRTNVSDAVALGALDDTNTGKINAILVNQVNGLLSGLSGPQIQTVIDQFAGATDDAGSAIEVLAKQALAAADAATVTTVSASDAAAALAALASAGAELQQYLNREALGSLSTLSSSEKLTEAQRQFSAALGGSDVGAATSASDALLQAASAYYASGTGYAGIEKMTRSQLSAFGRRLGLPGFAGGGTVTVGGAGGTDSQVIAMRVTPGETVAVTKGDTASAIVDELRALRDDLRGMLSAAAEDRAQFARLVKWGAAA